MTKPNIEISVKEGVEKFLPFSSYSNSDNYRPVFEGLGNNNFGFSRITLEERLAQRVHDMKNPLTVVSVASVVVKDSDPIFSDDCDIVKAKTADLYSLINSYLVDSSKDSSKGIKSIVKGLSDLDIFKNIGPDHDSNVPLGLLRNSYAILSGMVKQLDSNNDSMENAYSLLTLLTEKARDKYSAHSGVKVYEIISSDLKTHPLNVEDFSVIFNILMDNGVQAMNYDGGIKLSAGVKRDNFYMDFNDEGKGIPHEKVKEEFAEWLTN